jgi:hypothetical protein
MELLVNLIVKNITPNYTDLSWEFLDEDYWMKTVLKGIAVKGFNIYYSENPESLVKINQEIIDGFNYRHVTFNYDVFKNHYYQVELLTHNDKSFLSPIMTIFPKLFKGVFNTMRTHVFKLVGTLSGIKSTPVLFYQRRTTGVLCPSCGITKSMGSIRGDCPTCTGTGYLGGYYPATLAWVNSMTATNESVEDQGIMKVHSSSKVVNTSSFFLKPKVNDLYREITPPFRLFCVSAISQETESNNAPVSIIMNVNLEESGHPLYSSKIPFIPELSNKIYWDTMYRQIDEIRSSTRKILQGI